MRFLAEYIREKASGTELVLVMLLITLALMLVVLQATKDVNAIPWNGQRLQQYAVPVQSMLRRS